jgi:hypothetical protein
LAALVALALAICCGRFLLGGADDNNSSNQGTGGGDTTAQSPSSGEPGLGDPVRDGKFEFTVTEVECGQTSVGQGGLTQTAQGQFCLVSVTVKNIGDEPQTMSDGNQKGIGSNGSEYATDSVAGMYLNQENADLWLSQINPGNQVTGVLVFDVPGDVTLRSLKLHDSLFSGGVTVNLS